MNSNVAALNDMFHGRIIERSLALSQMEHFSLTDLQWPPRVCVRYVHETLGCPIPHFDIQKSARECPSLRPLCALDPHLCRACTGASTAANFYQRVLLLPDSQSGITSRKCGLRGRPRGFRVPFGTGPLALACFRHRLGHGVFLVRCLFARAFTSSLRGRGSGK